VSSDSGRVRDKVIIIGAGLSGLSAGCLLARRGIDVTVFEANDKPGGCCATTTVGGYTFHDGAVYLAVLRLLDHAFGGLGLDRAALVPLRRVARPFSVALPDDTIVTFGEGLDLRVEGRGVDQGRLQAELGRILRRWDPVFDVAIGRLATEPFSPWRSLLASWRHLHKFRGTVASEMRQLVTDEPIRAALTGTLLHMGVAPEQMPATAMLGLVAILEEGLFLPEGGMGSIPEVLVTTLRTQGAALRLGSAVSRITTEGGRATGIQLAGGETIEAASVISTVDPMSTFTSLVDRSHVPASTTRRIDRARLSHRAVSIQLGLRNRLQPRAMMNMVLPMMEHQAQVLAQDPRAVTWPAYSVPTMTLPELAPAGGSIVEMFVPVRADASLETWDERDKQAFAESAVRALGQAHDLDIVVSRVRTPRDFRDQMHLYRGALYGLSPAVPPQELFPQRSPIRGLFLAGQSTYPGYGVAPAIMSGIFAAEAAIASGLS